MRPRYDIMWFKKYNIHLFTYRHKLSTLKIARTDFRVRKKLLLFALHIKKDHTLKMRLTCSDVNGCGKACSAGIFQKNE